MDELEFVENANCPADGCRRTAENNFIVTAPLEIRPAVTIGDTTTVCASCPRISCEQINEGRACLLTVEQEIRVSIPITCNAEVRNDDITIDCARCPREE